LLFISKYPKENYSQTTRRMFTRLVNLFLAALGVIHGTNATIKDCGAGQTVFQLTELAMIPDPPVRGKPLDMKVVFNNPGAEVTDGTVATTLSLNFIPFQPSTEPLCKNTICPIVEGLNDRSTSSVWPDTVSGAVTSKITWTGPNSENLLCIQFNTKVAASENKTALRKVDMGEEYNQTHADALYSLLRFDDPVPVDAVGGAPF
jgi:hypothetical protein